jgi:hypothetical protein
LFITSTDVEQINDHLLTLPDGGASMEGGGGMSKLMPALTMYFEEIQLDNKTEAERKAYDLRKVSSVPAVY